MPRTLPLTAQGRRAIYFPSHLMVLTRTPAHLSAYYATFKCPPSMAKPSILSYLNNIYQLGCEDVRTVNLPPKKRRDRRGDTVWDTRWKHVIVKMKEPFTWPALTDVDKDFKGKEIKEQEQRAMGRVRGWKGLDKVLKKREEAKKKLTEQVSAT